MTELFVSNKSSARFTPAGLDYISLRWLLRASKHRAAYRVAKKAGDVSTAKRKRKKYNFAMRMYKAFLHTPTDKD